MNIKELIGKYKYLNHDCFRRVDTSEVLRDLKQLDEPEKVTIPQFIADWIKYCKNTNVSIARALLVGEVDFYNYANQKDLSRLTDFFSDGKNQEIFARAWIFGYTIEKEKRYWVKLKAVDQYLVSAKDEKFLGFLQSKLRSKFTRKELEDLGFGWVFDCEGVEVKEVEDE